MCVCLSGWYRGCSVGTQLERQQQQGVGGRGRLGCVVVAGGGGSVGLASG